jgi:ribose transport system ATP-binding protein
LALLSATNLSKSYDAVCVLTDVNFDLRAGEVHALVGENGAGKSTLCRILCGITDADAGTVMLEAASYTPRSRRDAEHAGVRIVMQELNLLPTLTVAESIFIASMPHRLGMIDFTAMNARAATALREVGLQDVRPNQLVLTLGVGQRQLVEIAAALSQKCRVLVLDEPTAALTGPEIRLLFEQIRRLQRAGVGIVYVSHRMEEIRTIANRITVLRDGKWIATRATADLSHDETVRLMVGRDLPGAGGRDEMRLRDRSSDVVMSVRGLARGSVVRDVSFDLHRGEVLGFAGLMGSGRTETMRIIFAADARDGGDIFLRGSTVPAQIRSPRDAVRHGIALLTEDRKSEGLLLPLPIDMNNTLTRMSMVSRLRCWIDRSREKRVSDEYAKSLSIRCRSTAQPVQELSGGNQQKVVLAKWLLRDCEILIFDEPTRGIDIGAKFEIYRLLTELTERGKSVIVVSSDLLELTAIADRIAVMSAGRLVRTFNHGQWTQESIMEAALSGYQQPQAATA